MGRPIPSVRPAAPVLLALVRLQAVAFWRAPYLGGRLALAAVKAAGVTYAVVCAAILGVVLPDLLGVVWPEADALALVERLWLPALGALTVGRLVFQEVPTRGASAFLVLPVSRERVAAGVLVRSLPSPFTLVPLVFTLPFAARTVRLASGASAALAVVGAAVALVVLSHALLVVWKARLGARPVATVVQALLTVAAVAGLEAATGGVLADVRGGSAGTLAVATLLAGLTLASAYRALVGALYLDGQGSTPVAREARPVRGFRQGGARAFADLTARVVLRATFPRGIVANAAVVSVALTVAVLLVGERVHAPTGLVLIFSTGTVAGSVGQYMVPFASGHYDRLLTLPGAFPGLVRASFGVVAAGTLAVAVAQLAVVLVLAPAQAWLVGVSVLFSLGVLAPAALWGSTLGPKPVDLSERFLGNTRVQSFGAQASVAGTAVVAGALVALAGTAHGALAAAALGLAGLAASPWWLAALVRRVDRRRHADAARFRSDL